MALQTRQSQHQHLAICLEHPDYSIGWQLVFSSQTTTNGEADGSTLVDATRPSGGADTYNGRWWVRCTSGDNKGIFKRVLDDDGSGTLTVEGESDSDGFPNRVLNDVTYELWKSPEAVVVVDASGSATNVVDDVRDEPDNYWEGHYLVPLTGNRRGEKALITGFVSASGTFSVSTGFSGALAAGDVCVMRKYIDVTAVRNGLSQAFNPRPMNRLDSSKGDGTVGPKAGSFGFDTYAQCGDVSLGSPLPPVIAPAIQACGFYEFKNGTGQILVAGSTTTALKPDTATWEYYTPGGLLSVEGEQAFVTALADGGGATDTVTVTPALGVAPDANAYVPEGWCYRRNRRNTDGDYASLTIEYEVDGTRIIMTGCKGNLTISGDAEVNLGFEFQVDHWVREYSPCCVDYLGDAYSTRPPVQAHERRCYFGSTAVELGAISASLNNEVAPRKVQGAYGINGRAGLSHVRANPGATFRKLLAVVSGEHLPADEQWFSRDTLDLMIFWGTTPYGGFAIRMAVAKLVQEPKPEDEEGQQVTPYVVEALDASSYTDPDAVVHTIPDFVIGFV